MASYEASMTHLLRAARAKVALTPVLPPEKPTGMPPNARSSSTSLSRTLRIGPTSVPPAASLS